MHRVRHVLWRRPGTDEGIDAGLVQVVERERDLQSVGRPEPIVAGAPVEL